MNPQIEKRLLKLSPRKIAAISLVTFILLITVIALQFAYSVLKSDRIYKGVHINNLDVGGLTTAELTELLKNSYGDKAASVELTLKYKDFTEKVKLSDFSVAFDIQGAVQMAHEVGRSGSAFECLSQIFKSSKENITLDMPVDYDKSKLENIVQSLYDKTMIGVKENELIIKDNKVIIRSGHHGENLDKEKTVSEIEKVIKDCKDSTIDIPVITTAPAKIDVEDYYKKITREPVDASFKVENNKLVIVPHITGISVDKAKLNSLISGLGNNESMEVEVPVTSTMPGITTDDVNLKLFRDVLATKITHFSTSNVNDQNRGENIRIAVSKINGTTLAPGQVFSFNQVVGARTENAGYKTAHTYVAGKIIDGIGGGICQVSTTLYNAVLYSDLETVERTNHMFTVGYVPYGTDAAVSYNQVDFKFKNSSKWPVKIEGSVTKDNRIVFSIKGTRETNNRTIEISPRTIKTTDFVEKFVDDPTLDEGVTKVEHQGMKGYIIDTYKIVKEDGKVVSETKLHTSVYRPYDKEIKRGTKKPDQNSVKSTPPPKVEGVDDADNPPEVPATPAIGGSSDSVDNSTPVPNNDASTNPAQ